MPMEHPKVLWQKAEHLAIQKGLTLKEIKARTGISLSALKKRSADNNWRDRYKAKMSFLEGLQMLCADKMEKALAGEDVKADSLYKLGKMMDTFSGNEGAQEAQRLDFAVEVWELICDVIEKENPDAIQILRRNTAIVTKRFEEAYSND